jgi:hypothetical protein
MAVHVLATMPPLIQVGLRSSRSDKMRGSSSQAVLRTGLIDTGASITAIHPDLIAAIRPVQLGTMDIKRSTGPALWRRTWDIRLAFEPDPQDPRWWLRGQWRRTWDIRLAFEPDPQDPQWWLRGQWFNLEAIEVTPASAGVDVLIGRDLLKKIVMSWDGPRSKVLVMY